jgi:tripartite ATP-independent transporter DctP family solute receptor
MTVLTGLQQGTHMMGLQGSSMASIEPGYALFEAPFLFGNREEVVKVIRAVEGELKKRVLKKNIIVLAIGELGFRQISNNVRPIVKPADLKGVKLRTPGNPFRIVTFKTFGANPTPMSYSEVYVALRSGVIDGQENPLESIWAAKFHEVQKYISISNHVFTPYSFVVSKFYWDKWPADVKKAIEEAAQVAADYSFVRGEELEREVRVRMKNSKFNDTDSAAFRKAAQPLYAKIEKATGPELWQKAMAALK